jgi:hypothetical protein
LPFSLPPARLRPELGRAGALIPSAARIAWIPFRDAINATHPIWTECRNRGGYFVVEVAGEACWVGRTAGCGIKVAFQRWVAAGAPTGECSWNDVINGRILFVTFPDAAVGEALLPGRAL